MLEFTQIEHNSSSYRDLVRFRRRILRAPLGLDFTPQQLEGEQADIHIGVYSRGELVGCAVLTLVDNSNSAIVKLRQMAVDPDHQGRGIGTQIVNFAEKLSAQRGYRETYPTRARNRGALLRKSRLRREGRNFYGSDDTSPKNGQATSGLT